MHSHSTHACGLHSLGNLYGVAAAVIPACAKLHRHRNLHRLHHRRQNIMRQLRLLHQRRALAVIDNLRHGTAHVEINHVRAAGLHHTCSLSQLLRHTAEKLNRRRTLAVINAQHLRCLDIFIEQALCTHHLRHRHATAKAAADKPEGQVSNACHRRQRQRRSQFYLTNLHN